MHCPPPIFHDKEETTMWKGNSKESLLSKLKELDEQISIDSVIRPGQKVKVTATADGCGFRNWAIEPDPEGYRAAKPVSGSKFGKFCDIVEHLAERRDVEIYSLKVLAYSGMPVSRTYDGKYRSRWFCIDPLCPYLVSGQTGQPEFEYREILATEEEHRMLMETKLAITAGEETYAVLRDALPMLGRLLLDSNAAFKSAEECLLGTALMTAAALAERDSLKFMARREKGSIHGLVTPIGDRYVYVPIGDFFQAVFRQAADFGIFNLKEGTVSDDGAAADIELTSAGNCKKGFFVRASNRIGSPMEAAAYGSFPGGCPVILKRGSMPHNRASVRKGVGQIFDGMEEAFADFDQFVGDMDRDVYFDPAQYGTELGRIRKLIGDKRYQAAGIPEAGSYNGIQLASALVGKLDAEIKDRWGLLGLVWGILKGVHNEAMRGTEQAVSAM